MADESDAASVVTSELATSAQRRTAAASMPSVRRYVASLSIIAAALVICGSLTATGTELTDWTLWLPSLFFAFVVAEYSALEVELRTGTIGIPLTEIPFAAALLFVPFPVALIASTSAVVARAIPLRQHNVTRAYNVAAACSEAAVLYLVATLALDLGTTQLASALLGLTASSMFGNVHTAGLSWAMGSSPGNVIRGHLAVTSLTMTIVSPLVVILGLELLRSGLPGLLLLAAVLTVFIVLYRSYAILLRERRDLDLVQRISESISGPDEAWGDVLELVRAQFNADRAVLRLPDSDVVVVRGRDLRPEDETIYARVDVVTSAVAGDAQRISRSTKVTGVADALRDRGSAEALVASLGTGSRAGSIELYDRQNSVRGFSSRDVSLLDTLARHAATVVDNRRLVAQLSHDAYHDRVTSLPNRLGFNDRIIRYLSTEQPQATRTVRAVLLINLGALSQVNDALGLGWGDRLILCSSLRISSTVPEFFGSETPICRIDGDTFAAFVEAASVAACEEVAGRFAKRLAEPYQVDQFAVESSVAIGIASVLTVEDDDEFSLDVDQLLQHADVAMQAARAAGESVRTYHDGMGQRFLRRFQLVTQFRAAMASGDVHVHEQPKLGLANRKVVGAEALLRWRHPVFGDVDPEELVQVLEATGLMMDLTSFVLDRSLARARHHLDQGLRIDPAVNVSVRNLLASSFPAMVTDALERHQVPAAMLTLEITETSVMGDAERTLPALRVLHELGISLSVDDFGTGYSSLSYLRRLPVDEIKIDKSFVLGMGADLSDHAVVRSIIDLGHSLDLRVVAEGVETDVVREQLADMGCDVIQGYLVSRALEPTRFDSWLHARTYREGGGLEGPAVAPTLARPSSR